MEHTERQAADAAGKISFEPLEQTTPCGISDFESFVALLAFCLTIAESHVTFARTDSSKKDINFQNALLN